MSRLVSIARNRNAARVLEIGAGTGNTTGPFVSAHQCLLTAVDRSAGMLTQAKGKGVPACWVQAAAHSLPVRAGSQGLVFGVYLLQFIRDLPELFGECRRVLTGWGAAAFVTASHEYIARHPMNAYFPSFAAIDQGRFPSVEQIARAFRHAGFRTVEQETFHDAPQPIGPAYVRKVAGKFISTFTLMSAEEFEAGLRALRADVAAGGRLDTELSWESVLIWAEK